MRDWQLYWRVDRGIFERICTHGVGHPDPDQFDYWKEIGTEHEAVHGCDGCCQRVTSRHLWRQVQELRECSFLGCAEVEKPPHRGFCPGHASQKRGSRPLKPLRIRGANHEIGIHNEIGSVGAHVRVRKFFGKATEFDCISCGGPAQDWAYDGTDPTELFERVGDKKGTRYSRYPEFYMPMCKKCHLTRDKGEAAAESFEYREFKHDTGLTLADVRRLLADYFRGTQ